MEGAPFSRISPDSREPAEIHVFVDIDGPVLLSGAAGFLIENAEIAKFLAEIKKKYKQRIRGNGKNLLKDENCQKAGMRVKQYAA